MMMSLDDQQLQLIASFAAPSAIEQPLGGNTAQCDIAQT
jgi:hypothetical protein